MISHQNVNPTQIGIEEKRSDATPLTMTIAASPSPATQHHNVLISLALLMASTLLTLYTHATWPASDSHAPCATPDNLILGLAVLLAYLAAVGLYTSQDGRILFPLAVVCYFGVLGVLVLSGGEDLRTGLGVILGVRMMWTKNRDRLGDVGDEEEARLVDETEGCCETGDGTCSGDGEDAALGQSKEKGDGRVDNGDGDVRVVAGEKTVPAS